MSREHGDTIATPVRPLTIRLVRSRAVALPRNTSTPCLVSRRDVELAEPLAAVLALFDEWPRASKLSPGLTAREGDPQSAGDFGRRDSL